MTIVRRRCTLQERCRHLADIGESTWSVESARRLVSHGLYLFCADDDPDIERREGFRKAEEHWLRRMEESVSLVETAALETGTPFWWIKGWAARRLLYGGRNRLMADLDLLLESVGAVESLAAVLRRHGFTAGRQRRPWPDNFELAMSSPQGVLVELHRSLGPERFAKRLQPPKPRGVGLLLPEEWMLVHAAVHVFQHAGHVKPHQWLDAWVLLDDEKICETAEAEMVRAGVSVVWVYFLHQCQRVFPLPRRTAERIPRWYAKIPDRVWQSWRLSKLVPVIHDWAVRISR